jgi:hypothetical protein
MDKVLLKWILWKEGVIVEAAFMWFRKETGGRHL